MTKKFLFSPLFAVEIKDETLKEDNRLVGFILKSVTFSRCTVRK